MDLVHELHTILNMLKGFRAGYTSRNDSQMMIGYKKKIYKVTIEEVDEGKLDIQHLSHIDDK
jgi:hypothetical protein